jgi:hypothetical protein
MIVLLLLDNKGKQALKEYESDNEPQDNAWMAKIRYHSSLSFAYLRRADKRQE